MDIEKIETEALGLSPEDRAKLAHRLLESLDTLSEQEAEQIWITEAKRRAQELESGAVSPVSAAELEARVQAHLR